ncbi:hypothetical protein V5E38_01285 [Rossellomorea sp. GAMAL-10_SWC]
MSLPVESNTELSKSENGTLNFQNQSEPVDFSVQPTEEGVRTLITIKDNTAPHEYKFEVDIPDGGKLVSSAEYLGEEYDTGEVFKSI